MSLYLDTPRALIGQKPMVYCQVNLYFLVKFLVTI